MSEQTPVPATPQEEERTRAQAERIAEQENLKQSDRTVQEAQAELLAAEHAGGTAEEKRADRDAVTGGKEAEAAVAASYSGQVQQHEKEEARANQPLHPQQPDPQYQAQQEARQVSAKDVQAEKDAQAEKDRAAKPVTATTTGKNVPSTPPK